MAGPVARSGKPHPPAGAIDCGPTTDDLVGAQFIAPTGGWGIPGRLLPVLPTIAILAAVLLAWEAVVRLWQVPAYMMPGPSAVLIRLVSDPGFFGREGLVTLLEALAGLGVGGLLALGAGLLMARWRWLERALLPVAIVAKVTPVVVVAPLFVLWFGFGAWPRVLIAALLAFFPILIGAVAGLRAVPTAAHEVLLTLDASAAEETLLLRLPSALPQLFAALKVATTLALLGAVVAEWVGGDRGLGRAILLANSNLDTVTALAGVATIAVIGMAMIGALSLLERRYVFWQAPLDRS